MKKISGLFIGFLAVIVLIGCSNNKNTQEQTEIEQQEKKIKALTHEKKELELLLENEKQKNSISKTIESSDEENVSTEELKSLFDNFIHAQFEQDNETLQSITTAELYTILVDKAGEKESSVSFQSTVKNIVVFQAEQISENEAVLVGKIEVETKVGELAPSRYQQLVECKAVRNSEGQLQVDSQELTNLMQ